MRRDSPARAGSEDGFALAEEALPLDNEALTGEPTIIVLPLTTQVCKSGEPLHVTISARDELRQDCQVMPERPRTLDRHRLTKGPLTRLRPAEMEAVEKSLLAVLGRYR